MKPAELRRWMIESTKVLENLLRMADGKRVQLHGPTGKTYWAETTPQMMAWAMERVLRKCVPDLSGITLSGDADAPIVTQHLDTPLGRDKELARRLALLQRVIDVPEESHDVPADGRPLGKGNGAVALSESWRPLQSHPMDNAALRWARRRWWTRPGGSVSCG